jgi:exopolyphosphatase / guanosine-5'-triphosphate,3'-diphosphate pyrophosphatase
MILAGIDIGTNTLRLLVAETGPDRFRELDADRRITRLGQYLGRTGMLSSEAMERSLVALNAFAERIAGYGAEGVAAVGTSALRKASNADAFLSLVRKRTGINISVISGDEEARLTLLGVAAAFPAGQATAPALDSAMIIDIGGGSTEVMITRAGGAAAALSLPLGAVYLTERFITHDPPHGDELALLRQAITAELAVLEEIAPRGAGRPLVCVGTAGTITTLAAMDQKLAKYDPARINGYPINRPALDRIVGELAVRSRAERRHMQGLEPGREDIVLAGAVVAQELMGRYGYGEMLVSDWGLREGIVLDLYRKRQEAVDSRQ